MQRLKTLPYFLFFIVLGCVEPFSPKSRTDAANILVVEGSINSANQSAQVKLTRAIPLEEAGIFPSEQFADVRIEELGGSTYPLNENGMGNYTTTGIAFDSDKKYRLSVRTSSGATYVSEYVEMINTPPIDSVSWRVLDDELSLEVNTHDDSDRAKFFIWSFDETWEYTSAFGSQHIWHPGGIVTERPFDDPVFKCWLTKSSTSIIIGTTKQLSGNSIRNLRVNTVAKGSIKLRFKYSINVKQRAISEEEYEFWKELQKTTQNVGGLFDPMPAQVTGNLTCTSDPDEPVIGFFSAGTTTEARKFVRWTDLPETFRKVPGLEYCEIDSVTNEALPDTPGPLYIISTYGMSLPEGYLISTYQCTDCRSVPGGVNKKPSFWIE